jgi:NAD(P)-dependent dehydrogenase (short-subunit alcohol dehydrogenase family)
MIDIKPHRRLARGQGWYFPPDRGWPVRFDRDHELCRETGGRSERRRLITAKHGLVGLMRTLVLELAPHSIRANSLHPTTVITDMVQNEATYELFRPDLESATMDDAGGAIAGLNVLPVKWLEPIDISNALTSWSLTRASTSLARRSPLTPGWLSSS